MITLALEFSSERRSVAVARGADLLAEVSFQGTIRTPIFHLVQSALSEAGVGRREVEVVVVGLGPGSYTGVRLAISVAQGWQLANGARTAGVNSLENLAIVNGPGRVLLAVDAQREELAVVEAGDGRLMGQMRLMPATELREKLRKGELIKGPDVVRLLGGGADLFPTASVAARFNLDGGQFIAAEFLSPIYLRDASFAKAPPSRVLPPTPAPNSQLPTPNS